MEWLRANRESYWLFRCRQNSTVSSGGNRYQVRQLAQQLTYSPTYREIKYKGKIAYQTTAHIAVDLVRAAKPKRKQPDKEKLIQGEALSAQLVISRVEDGYSINVYHSGICSVMYSPSHRKPSRLGIIGDGKSKVSSNCSSNQVCKLQIGSKKAV